VSRTDAIDARLDLRLDVVRSGRAASRRRRRVQAQGCVARALAQRLLNAGHSPEHLGELHEHPDHDDQDRQRESHFDGGHAFLVANDGAAELHCVLMPAVADK
jgi:hypothetical protein